MTYADEVLADDPWLFWKFDESSGSTAADSSGNGRAGSITGATPGGSVMGEPAFDFDGDGDYVSVAHPNVTFTGLSLEAWVQTSASGDWQVICGRDSPSVDFSLLLSGDGWPYFRGFHDNGNLYNLYSTVPINDGQPHLVTATWDHQPGGLMALYVDGLEVASRVLVDPSQVSSTRPFVVGIREITGGTLVSPFDGAIGNVSYYQHALPPARVEAHYAAAIGLPPIVNNTPPTVTGAARVGHALTASADTWTPTPDYVAYQWFADGVPIPGATLSSLTLTEAQGGKTITVRVRADASGYTTASATSLPVGPVWTPFGKPGPVYTTPDVRFVVSGAPWLADAAVSSWSVDRQLVASVVPGTIRSGNGLSIGAANFTAINTQSRVTPWSPDTSRLVSTDLPPGRLEVVDGSGTTLPLGSWVVAPTSGALSSREVAIELLEAQYAGKQVTQALPAYSAEPFDPLAPVDPVWAIARLAESAGLCATPPPVESAILVLPMDGSFMATVGAEDYPPGGETPGWTVLSDGTVGGESGTTVVMVATADLSSVMLGNLLRAGADIYLTLNVVGTAYLAEFVNGWQVEVVNDFDTGTHTIGVSNNGDGSFTTQTFTPGLDDALHSRVQIRLGRTWNDDAEQWTSTFAEARSSASAAWSTPAVSSGTTAPPANGIEIMYVFGGADWGDGNITNVAPGQFSGLQITRSDDPDLWMPSKALLQPIGGDMGLPWVPPDQSPWTAIQNICSAWLAAAILGNDGILRILTRDDLAGVPVDAPIIVEDDLADLPWSSDPNDRHDRIEVTYAATAIRNADLGSSKFAPVAWQADEVIHVPPNATITIDAALEDRAAVGIFHQFSVPGTTPSPYWSQTSSVNVFSNPEGEGASVDPSEFSMRADQTSATTARITYLNRSGSSQYLVTDADLDEGGGEPSLVLRAHSVATYTPSLIDRGASTADATNPLAVDLTPWVQRAQEATTVANYLWGRLSGAAWKVTSVRCRLDWTLDIGQVRMLTHPDSGLDAKVLITKVHYDGQPGEVAQTLDLVLLPWTYADFADAWDNHNPGASYADFATAQGPTRTYADMAADHNWTGDA